MTDTVYIVLDKENVDLVMQMTGLNEDELRLKYEESELFGHKRVYWRIGDRWFSLVVSGEYVHFGLLDRVVRDAIESSLYQIAEEAE